ncbi:MAG TPA: NADPH-dependent F420 reductase [Phenylobacterium sp.]|uniref:NADPH-dependent F420 reductase n=1 Tax=Phenylobacterium sp. TaxID=1871053 RepID=UPI002B461D63|nr:NADPH-dependent F420 reductase [Phenylobacterium sp.]HKR89874.1 NADPH-dependent F420 reductase [Phenylobacterium sp.]
MAKIAVVGGTGDLGSAIARTLIKAGHQVSIGSRRAESAAQHAAELGPGVGHGVNAEVARGCDFVIVTVPYSAQAGTLADIKDSVGDAIVVDTTVPLVPPKVMRVQLPAAGCAALEARELLGEGVRLVSAFHNVAAHKLAEGHGVDCDVLVFSDDVEARAAVVELACGMGLRGLAAGSLANSAAAEALTSILIFFNKTYKADGAGVRFTGLTTAPAVA